MKWFKALSKGKRAIVVVAAVAVVGGAVAGTIYLVKKHKAAKALPEVKEEAPVKPAK